MSYKNIAVGVLGVASMLAATFGAVWLLNVTATGIANSYSRSDSTPRMDNKLVEPPNTGSVSLTPSPAANPTPHPADIPTLLPGTPEQPNTGDAHGMLGDTLTVDGVRVGLSGLRYDPCPPEDYRAAYPGETYLIVNAKLTNDSFNGQPEYQNSAMLGAWDLLYTVPGDAGQRLGRVPLQTCHYPLPGDHVTDGDYLTIGRTVNTTLLFEIPTNAVNITIVWNGHTSLPDNQAYFVIGR